MLKVTASDIKAAADARGVPMPLELAARLEEYLALLFRWNERINLTSVGEKGVAVDRLLLEGVFAAGLLPSRQMFAIDIGSGAGSPAIPMLLTLGGGRLVLVESRQRKAAFLREAVRSLGLDGVRVAACRFDELTVEDDLKADVVTSRGVRVDAAIGAEVGRRLAPGGSWLVFGGKTSGAAGLWRVDRSVSLPGSGAGELFLMRQR
ncbi:MAG: 16S rRNA (guanine(527)-N(7))-methyltransferase RsmG [Acidobacteria bacterium]|nr:16S rRNA (guanine(527)-N(7))-methyltransferase RsmG [Acidobacteriota bacterium]